MTAPEWVSGALVLVAYAFGYWRGAVHKPKRQRGYQYAHVCRREDIAG